MGSLTFNIAIDSYTITPFSFFFYLIYSAGMSTGEENEGPLYPSYSVSYWLKQRAKYGKPHFSTTYFESTGTVHNCRFYGRGYGALFEGFESHKLEGEQGQNNDYLLHQPSTNWNRPDTHGATSATVPASPPSRAKPRKLQYPGRPWLCPPQATRDVQLGNYDLMILIEKRFRTWLTAV